MVPGDGEPTVTGATLRVELRQVRLESVAPLRAAHGITGDRELIVVRVTDPDGRVGWGECPALARPGYTAEYLAGCWLLLTEVLVPMVLADPTDAVGAMAQVAGHPMAKSALVGAMIDLDLRVRGRSLTAALADGAPVRNRVPSNAVIGLHDDLDELVATVDRALAAGHASVKLKVDPDHDVQPVRAIRQAWPELTLAVDANGSYANADVALDALRAVVNAADDTLEYVEQPLPADDLVGSAVLARRVGVPIALDESVGSIGDACTALAIGALGALNVKPARVGGPLSAMAVAQVVASEGHAIFCGGMLESGIGRAASLAFAAQSVCTGPTDLGPSARYHRTDLTPPFELEDGCLTVPEGLGIGVEPDPTTLDDCTVAVWRA